MKLAAHKKIKINFVVFCKIHVPFTASSFWDLARGRTWCRSCMCSFGSATFWRLCFLFLILRISAAAWIQSDNADCVFERRHRLVVNGYTGLSLKMHLSPIWDCLHLQLSFLCRSLSANLWVYSCGVVCVAAYTQKGQNLLRKDEFGPVLEFDIF